MSGQRGYNSYRGRTSPLKILLIVALVLVIAASAGFLVLQQYVVYDESGKPHFDFSPQTSSDASSSSPAASASSSGAQSAANVPLTVQEPEKPRVLRAVQLPEGEFSGWDRSAVDPLLQSADYNALAVTVKDSAGKVFYASDAASAATGQSEPASAGEALAGVTQQDGKTAIARLACFLDPTAAQADVEGMGLKNTGGYLFYDGSNENWLDPAKSGARTYLISLAKECAAQGFDELLLTDVSYPTEGKLSKIAYGTADRAANLRAFLTELRSALDAAGYQDMLLSLELPAETILSGSDANAGQSLAELAPCVDRIYARTTADEVSALTAQVTAAAADTAFVPELRAGSDPGALTDFLLLSAN